MPENKRFLPEGLRPCSDCSLQSLKTAAETGEILEGMVQRCGADHTLHLSLNGIAAQIPRREVNAPWINGSDRDIAILSRVGKQVCFTVQSVTSNEKGAPLAHLSRRAAQEAAMEHFLSHLEPGMVLTCRVTRMEPFGAFVDIGCGIIGLLPIERISVSRISHPKERFREGQKILAAVLNIDRQQRRITLTHRELLGTWLENASLFSPGETVQGIVRSVQEYGTFIELAPNLSGLAENRIGLVPGDRVSVYIKAIQPERMKIKLQVIEKLQRTEIPPEYIYQVTDGILERWIYSPPNYEKEPVETDFTAFCP